MATTRYFDEQVVRKRPYLSVDLCQQVLRTPLRIVTQEDGRLRYWGEVVLPDEREKRILRVVTLEDGIACCHARGRHNDP